MHGLYFQYLDDYERAVSGLDQALELNPNNADVLAHSIFLLKKAGQPERALDLVEQAVRLNLHHPDWYYGALREAYFYNRRFEDRSLQPRNGSFPVHSRIRKSAR